MRHVICFEHVKGENEYYIILNNETITFTMCTVQCTYVKMMYILCFPFNSNNLKIMLKSILF
jgi:hypothetical protein